MSIIEKAVKPVRAFPQNTVNYFRETARHLQSFNKQLNHTIRILVLSSPPETAVQHYTEGKEQFEKKINDLLGFNPTIEYTADTFLNITSTESVYRGIHDLITIEGPVDVVWFAGCNEFSKIRTLVVNIKNVLTGLKLFCFTFGSNFIEVGKIIYSTEVYQPLETLVNYNGLFRFIKKIPETTFYKPI
jgi:hypothetical protein